MFSMPAWWGDSHWYNVWFAHCGYRRVRHLPFDNYPRQTTIWLLPHTIFMEREGIQHLWRVFCKRRIMPFRKSTVKQVVTCFNCQDGSLNFRDIKIIPITFVFVICHYGWSDTRSILKETFDCSPKRFSLERRRDIHRCIRFTGKPAWCLTSFHITLPPFSVQTVAG